MSYAVIVAVSKALTIADVPLVKTSTWVARWGYSKYLDFQVGAERVYLFNDSRSSRSN
jgi:hypothetical protein